MVLPTSSPAGSGGASSDEGVPPPSSSGEGGSGSTPPVAAVARERLTVRRQSAMPASAQEMARLLAKRKALSGSLSSRETPQ